MENVIGVFQGVLQVVGHHDDGDALGAVQVRQRAVHVVGGLRVKARHRLVQDQQLPRRAQGPGQQHPLLLSAGQLPVAAVFQLQHTQLAHVHQRLGFFGGGVEEPALPGAEEARQHHLVHRGGEVPLGAGLLGQIPDGPGPERPVQHDPALHGLQKAQQALQQRGFAAAVLAYDAQIVAAVHLKIQMAADGFALVAQRRVMAVDQQFFLVAHCNPSRKASTFCSMRLR